MTFEEKKPYEVDLPVNSWHAIKIQNEGRYNFNNADLILKTGSSCQAEVSPTTPSTMPVRLGSPC